MECNFCGRLTTLLVGGTPVCEECYEKAGSCCLEFGGDDLWQRREEESGIATRERGEGVPTMAEHDQLFPAVTREIAEQRKNLAPGPAEAFRAFSRSVFADGALSAKTKQLIAVAVAHVTQCPYCIRAHTREALRPGATAEEIMEAVWVAAEMRAGAAYAHSALALDTVARVQSEQSGQA
jgi:AhpD family alkylhydroperoxidase